VVRRGARWVVAATRDRRVLAGLAIVNLAGGLYGFSWYSPQIAITPPYAWPLLIDSPLSALAFSAAAALLWAGRRVPAFEGFACVAVTKYGLWTTVVIGAFWATRGSIDFENGHLLLSHFGMAVEGALVALAFPVARRYLLVGGAWALLNDWADYAQGLHPTLPAPEQLPWARASALGLTPIVVIALCLLAAWGESIDHRGGGKA